MTRLCRRFSFNFLQLTTIAKRAVLCKAVLRSPRFCSSFYNSSSNNTCQKQRFGILPPPFEGKSKRHLYTTRSFQHRACALWPLLRPGFRVREPDSFWPRYTGPPQYGPCNDHCSTLENMCGYDLLRSRQKASEVVRHRMEMTCLRIENDKPSSCQCGALDFLTQLAERQMRPFFWCAAE